MSYTSMTLKNVMGGCELVDLKPPKPEKSLYIDLSLIGVNLHELQKNLVSNLSHNQNDIKVGSVSTAVQIESDFSGENSKVESKDNNNNDFSVQSIDDKMVKSIVISESECNLELYDLNANKVVKAEPNDSPPPVFTSIQNFYETFDVSDQIESMTETENVVNTPSSKSTFDSSYEQEMVIYEPTIDYQPNLEVTPTVTSMTMSAEDRYELHFIPTAVNPQCTTHPLLASQESAKGGADDTDKSDDNLESKLKKRKIASRAQRKKPSVEKNISCSRCNKKFRTTAHLKVHFMVHMDSECVHRCTMCERRFCHRGALTLHTRKHLMSKPAYDISS